MQMSPGMGSQSHEAYEEHTYEEHTYDDHEG